MHRNSISIDSLRLGSLVVTVRITRDNSQAIPDDIVLADMLTFDYNASYATYLTAAQLDPSVNRTLLEAEYHGVLSGQILRRTPAAKVGTHWMDWCGGSWQQCSIVGAASVGALLIGLVVVLMVRRWYRRRRRGSGSDESAPDGAGSTTTTISGSDLDILTKQAHGDVRSKAYQLAARYREPTAEFLVPSCRDELNSFGQAKEEKKEVVVVDIRTIHRLPPTLHADLPVVASDGNENTTTTTAVSSFFHRKWELHHRPFQYTEDDRETTGRDDRAAATDVDKGLEPNDDGTDDVAEPHSTSARGPHSAVGPSERKTFDADPFGVIPTHVPVERAVSSVAKHRAAAILSRQQQQQHQQQRPAAPSASSRILLVQSPNAAASARQLTGDASQEDPAAACFPLGHHLRDDQTQFDERQHRNPMFLLQCEADASSMRKRPHLPLAPPPLPFASFAEPEPMPLPQNEDKCAAPTSPTTYVVVKEKNEGPLSIGSNHHDVTSGEKRRTTTSFLFGLQSPSSSTASSYRSQRPPQNNWAKEEEEKEEGSTQHHCDSKQPHRNSDPITVDVSDIEGRAWSTNELAWLYLCQHASSGEDEQPYLPPYALASHAYPQPQQRDGLEGAPRGPSVRDDVGQAEQGHATHCTRYSGSFPAGMSYQLPSAFQLPPPIAVGEDGEPKDPPSSGHYTIVVKGDDDAQQDEGGKTRTSPLRHYDSNLSTSRPVSLWSRPEGTGGDESLHGPVGGLVHSLQRISFSSRSLMFSNAESGGTERSHRNDHQNRRRCSSSSTSRNSSEVVREGDDDRYDNVFLADDEEPREPYHDQETHYHSHRATFLMAARGGGGGPYSTTTHTTAAAVVPSSFFPFDALPPDVTELEDEAVYDPTSVSAFFEINDRHKSL